MYNRTYLTANKRKTSVVGCKDGYNSPLILHMHATLQSNFVVSPLKW